MQSNQPMKPTAPFEGGYTGYRVQTARCRITRVTSLVAAVAFY